MLIPSIQSRRRWLFILLVAMIGLELYFNFSFKSGVDERSRWIDKSFGRLTLPFEFLVSEIQSGALGSVRSVGELMDAKNENAELKELLREQALSIHLLEELRLENQRLKQLLGFRETQPLRYLPARIVGKDPSSFYRTIIIDRGESDGIVERMPVVSTQGLVGYIFQTGKWTSRVLLITDVNSTVDAVVQRSRNRAIVGGSLDGGLDLRFFPRRQDVRIDDILVTSGLGGIYPPGFKIGHIRSVKKNPHLVLEDVEVEPTVQFDAIEEVLIVIDNEPTKG